MTIQYFSQPDFAADTLYFKPAPWVVSPWGGDVVAVTNLGNGEFSLDVSVAGTVFVRAGAAPALGDLSLMDVDAPIAMGLTDDQATQLSTLVSRTAGSGGVAGGTVCTITITDDSDNVLSGVSLWLYSDSDMAHLVQGPLVTDDSGQTSATLTTGTTYYRKAKLAGYNFTNPTSKTAAASMTFGDATAATDAGSEPTLLLQYTDLQSAVAVYLGLPSDSTSWDTAQTASINRAISSGLRQFYFPPLAGRSKTPHRWSFLRPEATLSLVKGTTDYALPDDFGGMIGDCVYVTTSSDPDPVRLTSAAYVNQMLHDDTQAQPTFTAIIPQKSDGASDQQYKLRFGLTPDDSYTVKYQYQIQPNDLSSVNPYPYGGETHSQTILQSCLACADSQGSRAAEKTDSYELFMRELERSIAYDQMEAAPGRGRLVAGKDSTNVTG